VTTTAPQVRKPGPLPRHGTASRYRRGCTCRPCTSAATAEAKKWEYLRSIGRSSLVSPGPAIARIWALRAAGMTDLEIDEAADLKSGRLNFIIRTGKPIRHFTAARILAIPVPEPSSEPTKNGAFVPAIGTVRRLQTLTAEGWPAKHLEQRLGTGTGYVSYLLRAGTSGTVRLFTAAAVRRLYADLSELSPEEHGVPAGAAKVARNRAVKSSWPLAAYWDPDDFDNPDFAPAAGRVPRYMALGEDCTELERQGHTREQIAERLGVTRDGLQRALSLYRKVSAATAAAA